MFTVMCGCAVIFFTKNLYETIKDFHNTPIRYENFLKALEKNASGRANTALPEIEFVKARKDFTTVLEDSFKKGVLPKRVTHNDTKINNVMLDKDTREPVCVVDLDTIMPGYSVNDFGDSIRFGASTAAEDERDLEKVHFDINLFETYTRGFLNGCGGTLTPEEIMLLPEGAKMMTLECGMRFLTDYLDGDTYFKTDYPEHNLVRCRTQFKLVEEMEQQWDKMKETVKRHITLHLRMDDGKLLISLKNTFAEKPLFTDGIPISSKKDHGFGTQSIRYVTEKLNGNCQFSVKDDWFILRIVL